MNGLKLKIIGAILSGVFLASLALIGWYADTQAGIDREQNVQIEKRVRISRYDIDQQIMRDWLKRVEIKLDEALK